MGRPDVRRPASASLPLHGALFGQAEMRVLVTGGVDALTGVDVDTPVHCASVLKAKAEVRATRILAEVPSRAGVRHFGYPASWGSARLDFTKRVAEVDLQLPAARSGRATDSALRLTQKWLAARGGWGKVLEASLPLPLARAMAPGHLASVRAERAGGRQLGRLAAGLRGGGASRPTAQLPEWRRAWKGTPHGSPFASTRIRVRPPGAVKKKSAL
ncbi:hypothetical protein [Deinococcus hopiensis]|uniref:Uncharacterized protein n=1 Tax=Deinococcus hopiensis KR-140 TaxID=695939 RepID=A0A1W1VPR3_9DEIO|nr:hypothetical protein [Deinococcus hopiensis]SMB95263.1 hypothetical protein SAMN00790413_02763 [Deinococcus hopiensis KR-140]